MTPRLKEKYFKEIVQHIQKEMQYKTPMQVARLLAIHINQGLKEAKDNTNVLNTAIEELTFITGQKAVPTVAKKSIANFKLRTGMYTGVRVTLRGNNMYHFLDRFISFALPRTRDFSGLNEKSFDQQGNYTCGIKEQIIFPEISIDKVNKIRGMDITFVTSAKNRMESYKLLRAFGMPFKDIHKSK